MGSGWLLVQTSAGGGWGEGSSWSSGLWGASHLAIINSVKMSGNDY